VRDIVGMLLGFLVNPIAGMGGRVGLKGTDGVVEEAIRRGAKPVSPFRAKEFLSSLDDLCSKRGIDIRFVSCRFSMGEEIIGDFSFDVKYVDVPRSRDTSALDTVEAVSRFVEEGVSLVVFVGGDGTARDVYTGLERSGGLDIPILGVPSGVKIYSGVFAITPRDAAYLLIDYIDGRARVMDLEIMDIDEDAFRSDRIEIRLYAYAKALYMPFYTQGSKEVSPDTADEVENQEAIAKFIVEEWDRDGIYILGPGTTVKRIADILGIKKTLLGVDVYCRGRVYNDVSEREILDIIGGEDAWIIVTPIGRQGILFGRGNQQISPNVIRRVGRDRIIVVATQRKLRDIPDGVLRVDTQDPDVDRMLRGYIRVVVDYRTWRMVRIV
jgi:predicted polyphosphate/ATP-dependent NAD kinase